MSALPAERDALVLSNLRLVHYVISRRNSPLPPEDQFSAGALALISAARTFDPSRGFQFSTYATLAIRRGIRRAESGPQAVREQECSLEALLTEVEDHGRALVDEAAPDPEAAAVALLERLELARAVDQLGERDAQIVRLRFGFEDGQEWSLREIGRRWGISAEGVRSILTRALRKLRDQLQGDAARSAA